MEYSFNKTDFEKKIIIKNQRISVGKILNPLGQNMINIIVMKHTYYIKISNSDSIYIYIYINWGFSRMYVIDGKVPNGVLSPLTPSPKIKRKRRRSFERPFWPSRHARINLSL